MKIWKDVPENSFWETGFYIEQFPNWRYTGKFGLVWHDIPLYALPKPYGSMESIEEALITLPWYLFNQIGVSFQTFGLNLTRLYHSSDAFLDDAISFPFALADFIPATFTTLVSVTAPIWLVPLALMELFCGDDWNEGGLIVDLPRLIGLGLLFLPLIVLGGVLVGAYGLISSALMFVKAGVETALSVVTTASIPFKAAASMVSFLVDKVWGRNKVVTSEPTTSPTISTALAEVAQPTSKLASTHVPPAVSVPVLQNKTVIQTTASLVHCPGLN